MKYETKYGTLICNLLWVGLYVTIVKLLLLNNVNIVVYRPIAGQGLEANNGTAAVAVQRRGKCASTATELLLGKHVPSAGGTDATGKTECCLRRPRRGAIKRENWDTASESISIREAEK